VLVHPLTASASVIEFVGSHDTEAGRLGLDAYVPNLASIDRFAEVERHRPELAAVMVLGLDADRWLYGHALGVLERVDQRLSDAGRPGLAGELRVDGQDNQPTSRPAIARAN
jgi:hypothetical protein